MNENTDVEAQVTQFFKNLKSTPKRKHIRAFYDFIYWKIKDTSSIQVNNLIKTQIPKFLSSLKQYDSYQFNYLLELSRDADNLHLKGQGENGDIGNYSVLEYHVPFYIQAIESAHNDNKTMFLEELLCILNETNLLSKFQNEISSLIVKLWEIFVNGESATINTRYGKKIINTTFDRLSSVATLVYYDYDGILNSKFPEIEQMYHKALKEIEQLPEFYFYDEGPSDPNPEDPTIESLKYDAFKSLAQAAYYTGHFSEKFLKLLEICASLRTRNYRFKVLGLENLLRILAQDEIQANQLGMHSRIQFSKETLKGVEEHIFRRLDEPEVFQKLLTMAGILARTMQFDEKYFLHFFIAIRGYEVKAQYGAIYSLFLHRSHTLLEHYKYFYRNMARYLLSNIDKCTNFQNTYKALFEFDLWKKPIIKFLDSVDNIPKDPYWNKSSAVSSIFDIAQRAGVLDEILPLILKKFIEVPLTFSILLEIFKQINNTPLFSKFKKEFKLTYHFVIKSMKKYDLGQSYRENLLDIALEHDWLDEYFSDFLDTYDDLKGPSKFGEILSFYTLINKTKSTTSIEKYWDQIKKLYFELKERGASYRRNVRYLKYEQKIDQLMQSLEDANMHKLKE